MGSLLSCEGSDLGAASEREFPRDRAWARRYQDSANTWGRLSHLRRGNREGRRATHVGAPHERRGVSRRRGLYSQSRSRSRHSRVGCAGGNGFTVSLPLKTTQESSPRLCSLPFGDG